MLDRIEFILSEAFIALRRNRWMTFAAITTATMALFILGGITYIFLSIQKEAARLTENFEMRVFLRLDVERENAGKLKAAIGKIPGVSGVRFITKEEAWADYQKKFPKIVEGLENPLPDTLHVSLHDLSKAPLIGSQIQKFPEVEPENGVRYLDDARQFVTDGMRLLRWLATSIGIIMLLTSGILIYNTIRMTIVARRREIRIMQLVGATQRTIMTPMFIEGLVQGAIGGLLAGFLLYGCTMAVASMGAGLTIQASKAEFPLGQVVFWLGLAGAAYGLLCSIFAMRDPRKIR